LLEKTAIKPGLEIFVFIPKSLLDVVPEIESRWKKVDKQENGCEQIFLLEKYINNEKNVAALIQHNRKCTHEQYDSTHMIKLAFFLARIWFTSIA